MVTQFGFEARKIYTDVLLHGAAAKDLHPEPRGPAHPGPRPALAPEFISQEQLVNVELSQPAPKGAAEISR